MAMAGLKHGEQWALLGVAMLIVGGLGWQGWLARRSDVIYVEGQGHWQRLAEVQSQPAAPPHAGEPDTAAPATGEPPAMQFALPLAGVQGAGGLELNTATAIELEEVLPGIGPARAAAIIETRARLGGFRSADELLEVPGIGEKTLAKLLPYIRVEPPAKGVAIAGAAGLTDAMGAHAGEPPEATGLTPMQGFIAAQGSPGGTGAGKVIPVAPQPFLSAPAGPAVVNINTAGFEELQEIKGIGPVLARRILEYRQRHGGFRAPAELKNIQGIGDKTYLKMRPQVKVQD